MRSVVSSRWAISFADLALILLGAFAMLYALQPAGLSGVTAPPAARRSVELTARELFEPGEARLSRAGRTRLLEVGKAFRGPIDLESAGHDGGNRRLDAYELAAARTMAVARLLRGSRDVSVTVRMVGDGSAAQRLFVRAAP